MKIIYGVNNIRKIKKAVVAMGVFDGIHRGHREILQAAVKKAHGIGGKSVALTFWPHPQQEESLYSLEHRLRLIAELGSDVCLVINFSRNFARIKAEDFIKNILVAKIGAAYVYVGKDFRFGAGAKGDFYLLQKLGKVYGFSAQGFKIIKVNGVAITSTLIRRLIKQGKIKEAERLLARPVSILGTVIKGTKIGRILGYPTANINPHHEVIPAGGIYAVRVFLNNHKFKGACYIGSKSTIGAGAQGVEKKISVEVYIFGFHKNIYGKYLEIQFAKRIRPDKKFPSLALLAKQIKKDVISAKRMLN